MTKKKSKKFQKAWVVTVDMGYGHQRAAHPLRFLAEEGKIITANNYSGIPEKDRQTWHQSRQFYEFISRFKKVPFLGEKVFELYDKFQSIDYFYPRRDLSKPNFQLKGIYKLIKRNTWGEHLIKRLSKRPLPLVTTFFITAFMAEYFNYRGEIYCLATDTDISRTWVPLKPQTSRIFYFAPNKRVVERLKLYGVRPQKIFLTGFPLPEANLGKKMKIVKEDLVQRLINLDPKKVYHSQYQKTLIEHFGASSLKKRSQRPLTITFAVGGAGVQRELGGTIIKSLREYILSGKIKINLIAGIHSDVKKYFLSEIRKLGLEEKSGKGVKVLFKPNKLEYFNEFDKILRTTDILWTKPSELSFYCALGLPIIIAPPIGSQEIFNRKWLQSLGSGIFQENPKYVNEWLFDWLDSGRLADAAVQGFLEAPKYGSYNIKKIIAHEFKEAKELKTVLLY